MVAYSGGCIPHHNNNNVGWGYENKMTSFVLHKSCESCPLVVVYFVADNTKSAALFKECA